ATELSVHVQNGAFARVPDQLTVTLTASVLVVTAPAQFPLFATTVAQPVPQVGAPMRSQRTARRVAPTISGPVTFASPRQTVPAAHVAPEPTATAKWPFALAFCPTAVPSWIVVLATSLPKPTSVFWSAPTLLPLPEPTAVLLK